MTAGALDSAATTFSPAAKRVKLSEKSPITVRAFRAIRPARSEDAKDVASVPYDVINTAEARKLRKGNDKSFLRVVRPEVDMPEGVDEYSTEVYKKGAENLNLFVKQGLLKEDKNESVYLYKLKMGDHEQIGLACCVCTNDYDNNRIMKHEHTRPVKENDRVRHIMTVGAHTEPIMLVYEHKDEIDSLVSKIISSTEPKYDFTCDDGVHHSLYRVKEPEELLAKFQSVQSMYIADGHHRGKAASRIAASVRGEDDIKMPSETKYDEVEHKYFPAVVFPANQMNVMPYNRVIFKLPFTQEDFMNKLSAIEGMTVKKSGVKNPAKRSECSMFMNGEWYTMTLPEPKVHSAANDLDVARLSEYVLEPILGIDDPRTNKNIGFVGGIRGVGELEKLVNENTAEVAFSMYATDVNDLLHVSEAGLLMPPKSTWFEPKLRSGLFVHRL